MAKIFITLTGTKHYFGNDFLEKGMKIRLEKEPDNEYDKEAIKVTYLLLEKLLNVPVLINYDSGNVKLVFWGENHYCFA